MCFLLCGRSSSCPAQCRAGGLCSLSGKHFFIRAGGQSTGRPVWRSAKHAQECAVNVSPFIFFSLCELCLVGAVQILLTGSPMKPVTPALPARLRSLSSAGSITAGAVGRYERAFPLWSSPVGRRAAAEVTVVETDGSEPAAHDSHVVLYFVVSDLLLSLLLPLCTFAPLRSGEAGQGVHTLLHVPRHALLQWQSWHLIIQIITEIK